MLRIEVRNIKLVVLVFLIACGLFRGAGALGAQDAPSSSGKPGAPEVQVDQQRAPECTIPKGQLIPCELPVLTRVLEPGVCSGNCTDGYGACVTRRKPCQVYSGEWKQGKAEGVGALQKAEGELLYQGEWKAGMRHGTGTIFSNGRALQRGKFENDNFIEKAPKKFVEEQHWGIAPGIVYLFAWGKREYIGEAYVNGFGIVTVGERLQRVSRFFPSIYGYYKFKDHRVLADGFTFGFMLGINEGVESKGRGFALAIGPAAGYRVGPGYFSLFWGLLLDPTIKRLPSYLKEGDYYYFLPAAQVTGSQDAIAANARIPLPLETFLGSYTAFGISYTFSIGD